MLGFHPVSTQPVSTLEVAGGTTSASIATTDAADVAAISATVTTGAVIAGTDAADVAAITAANWTTSQIAATDAPDVAAIATTVTTGAAIATTDGADTAVITGDSGTPAVATSAPPSGGGKRKRKHVFIGDRHYFVDDAELSELLYQFTQRPKPKIAQQKPEPPKRKVVAVIKPGVVKPVNMETALALEAQAKALHEDAVLKQIQEIIRREREDDEDVEMLLLVA